MTKDTPGVDPTSVRCGPLGMTPAAIFDDRRATDADRSVLGLLSTYANRDRWCHVKLATLAERRGCSPQAVSRVLQHLRELGYVGARPQFREDGSQRENEYRILFDQADPPVAQVEPPSTSEVEPPSTSEVEAGTAHLEQLPPEDVVDPTLDGMPLAKAPGCTYSETLARWLGSEGLPIKDERHDAYAEIVAAIDLHVAKSHPKRTGQLIAVMADYVLDTCSEPLAGPARGMLGRFINSVGANEAMACLAEAVIWGAGLDDQRKPDSRDLVKYAVAVHNGRTKKAS